MSIEDKFLKVTMPDRSKWKIPVRVIAEHRARYYAEKGVFSSLLESLKQDTLPLFEDDECEIEDWSENNMCWTDVEKYAEKIKDEGLSAEDLEEGWRNGSKEIVTE